MLNNCLLTGNLGADPEVFYSLRGRPHCHIQPGLSVIKEKDQLDQDHLLQQAR